jgi:hypothetical protein
MSYIDMCEWIAEVKRGEQSWGWFQIPGGCLTKDLLASSSTGFKRTLTCPLENLCNLRYYDFYSVPVWMMSWEWNITVWNRFLTRWRLLNKQIVVKKRIVYSKPSWGTRYLNSISSI